ncbi:hypothetical protein SAMN06297144_2435 [Sphingomonas guangdongensis]|uniref:Uncharacterized protein n=1 Tax=Sphingomonas guangdongensis TaxID=1141890 RepID=A0A285R4M4_9SPHN|nr:hypothetical protein [Sphingomonas guangdongensis]SOB87307.1 hypothetical protein SAMN06297144_2435 [Sphingomonas guangdongensis]
MLFGHVIRMVDRLTTRRAAADAAAGATVQQDAAAPIATAPPAAAAQPPSLPLREVDGVAHALGDAYAPGDDVPPEMITLMLQLARDGSGNRASG